MNIKLLGIVALMTGALVACGDDTSGGGGTGGSSDGGGDTGGSPATGGGGSGDGGMANGGGGAGDGGAGGGQASCDEQFPDGLEAITVLVVATCGCEGYMSGGEQVDPPCGDLCADNICTGGDSTDECSACLQNAGDTQDACALAAATSDECQNDPPCADYVTCVISGG